MAPFMTDDPQSASHSFARLIADLCAQSGYTVIMLPAQPKNYDIELEKDGQRIAVQVKNHKAKCNVAQVQKFRDFIDSPSAARFAAGWLISASGFGRPALTLVEREDPVRLCLGTYADGRVFWDYPRPADESQTAPVPSEPQRLLRYIGVFTGKGGVGKTTVAAHLAGAFALMGHDVILLDLDPDKNLRKLFLQDPGDDGDASLYVPPRAKKQAGATITVLSHDQWREEHYPDIKIVICDCSPVLAENPRTLVAKFDYCIIPTTLNPLGIAKNADVIIRTFKYIRDLNEKTELFVVINAYHEGEKRNALLLDYLQRHIASYTRDDPKCKFIHPEAAKIRYSTALLYWGYHLIEGTRPQLAFRETAGQSYPRVDFLQLAEYLEYHTDIDQLRREESGADPAP